MTEPHTARPTDASSSRARIAVLGAGYIGTALAVAATARSDEVWAIRRSTTDGPHDGVRWLRADITGGRITGLPGQLDAVVLTIAPGGSGDYAGTYPPAASAAVALARATGAALVYTSSTGVYGGVRGEWVTEESPRNGSGPGNDALRAAEDIVLASGLPGATVLRVAGIYGPGRDPRARMRNAALLPQRGAYWSNLAHRDDIVRAIFHALVRRQASPQVFNVSDGCPTLAADVARWLSAQRGDDPDTLAFGNDAMRSRNDQRVSNARLVHDGWSPRYPSFRDGFTHGL